MSSILYDARHWRDRAEAARLLAEQLADPKAKATMLEIATGYDTLAENATARAKGPPKG
jgi:hypothetical protein